MNGGYLPNRCMVGRVGIPGPIRARRSLSPFGNAACRPHCRTLPTYIVVFTWHVRYPFAPIPTGAQTTPLLPSSCRRNSQHKRIVPVRSCDCSTPGASYNTWTRRCTRRPPSPPMVSSRYPLQGAEALNHRRRRHHHLPSGRISPSLIDLIPNPIAVIVARVPFPAAALPVSHFPTRLQGAEVLNRRCCRHRHCRYLPQGAEALNRRRRCCQSQGAEALKSPPSSSITDPIIVTAVLPTAEAAAQLPSSPSPSPLPKSPPIN